MKVGDHIVSIKTQPLSLTGTASKGTRKVVGGAVLGAAIGGIAGGGEGAAIPAQTPEAFTLAIPLQVDIMSNVAVR